MSTTLVIGGARSGKSRLAERLVGPGPATYVATGAPDDGSDPEWSERLRHHRERRPASWTTVETLDVAAAIRAATTPVLVDCLGTWLARVVDECGGWEDPAAGSAAVASSGDALLAACAATAVEVVLVTNEVGLGVVPASASGRWFRDELGRLNAAVSAASDRVLLTIAGRVLDLTGSPPVDRYEFE